MSASHCQAPSISQPRTSLTNCRKNQIPHSISQASVDNEEGKCQGSGRWCRSRVLGMGFLLGTHLEKDGYAQEGELQMRELQMGEPQWESANPKWYKFMSFSPAQPSPAQPSPAQPSPAQPSPAQPSPPHPTPPHPTPPHPVHLP